MTAEAIAMALIKAVLDLSAAELAREMLTEEEIRRAKKWADDLADACIFLMDNYSGTEVINIGFGDDTAIKDLAMVITL